VTGLSQGKKLKKHGLRASHTAEVFLDDVRLPGTALLGGKEKLDERLARARRGRRPAATPRCRRSSCRGTSSAPRRSASRGRRTSTRSTTPRSASSSAGRSSTTRASAFKLADMKVEIDAARLLVWRAGWMSAGTLRGKPIKYENGEGSMAKLKAGEVA
jgi:alkylation response protein AidB-like acyl-CoA dehydrogenase